MSHSTLQYFVNTPDGAVDSPWRRHVSVAGGLLDTFAIDPTTGQIKLAAALDYETSASFTITVVATDGGGLQVTTLFPVLCIEYSVDVNYNLLVSPDGLCCRRVDSISCGLARSEM